MKWILFLLPLSLTAQAFDAEVLDQSIQKFVSEGWATAAAVSVRKFDGKLIYENFYGHELSGADVNQHSIFDLASLSKLFTTTILLKSESISARDPITKYFPTAPKGIFVEDLLRHRAGLPPGIAPKALPHTDEETLQKIVSLLRPAPQPFVYSDLDFLLVAGILKMNLKKPLADAMKQLMDELGLAESVHFTSLGEEEILHFTGSESKRPPFPLLPHDPTAKLMPSLAGHAGVFSSLHNINKFVQSLFGPAKYLTDQKFRAMIAIDDNGRALGWDHSSSFADALRLDLVSAEQHLGHTGYTGTSISLHLEKQYSVVLLTNRTRGKFSEDLSGVAIKELWKVVHRAVHSQL